MTTTTTTPIDAVKAALRVVEQKRAAKNRIEKLAETKIAEAKARVEKQYNDKVLNANAELEAALETFRAAADIFKNGDPVAEPEAVDPEATEDAELNEAI